MDDTRLLRAVALAGAVLLVPLLAAPAGVVRQLAWLAVSLLALAAVVIGPRRHPPARPHQGWLLTIAMSGFVVVNLIDVVAWDRPGDDPLRIVSTALFPVAYLLIGVAMVRLVAARCPDGDPEGRIDALLVMIATATMLHQLFTVPGAAAANDVFELTVFAALPIIQAPVIAAAARLLLTGAHRSPSAWALLVAASGGLVGNVQLVLEIGHPWRTISFATAYLGLAIAAAHPSYVQLSAPSASDTGQLSLGRLAVIAATLLSLPVVLLLEHGTTGTSVVPLLAATLCVVLVLWRLARLLRDRERAWRTLNRTARREAVISGLGHEAVTSDDRDGFLTTLVEEVGEVLGTDVELVAPGTPPGSDPAALSVPLGELEPVLTLQLAEGTALAEDDRRFLATVADLSAAALARWRVEQELRHLGLHDALTGLPNRRLTLDRLSAALARTDRHDIVVAVLFCDLDGFKAVNDRHGHAAGDELLITVADRLSALTRDGDTVGRVRSDTVGRLAGDEFVVIAEVHDVGEARELAARIRTAVSAPVVLASGTVRVGVSVGVTVGRRGDDPEVLLRTADAAMYAVKPASSRSGAPAPTTSSPAAQEPGTLPAPAARP